MTEDIEKARKRQPSGEKPTAETMPAAGPHDKPGLQDPMKTPGTGRCQTSALAEPMSARTEHPVSTMAKAGENAGLCYLDCVDQMFSATVSRARRSSSARSSRLYLMDDQSEMPIRAAPPSPVMTSGMWSSVCTYMITERIRMA